MQDYIIENKSVPVNVIDKAVVTDMARFFKNHKEPVLLSSNRADFVLGADVKGFGTLFQAGPHTVRKYLKQVKFLLNHMANRSAPVIALINGNCMGGGLELALACDYRIARSDAKFALPEVKLGIIPGWDGTVRMPRLIGFENAIDLISSGRTVDAKEALRLGLVDAIVDGDITDTLLTMGTKRRLDDVCPISNAEAALASHAVLGMVKSQAKAFTAPVVAAKLISDMVTGNADFKRAAEKELSTFVTRLTDPQAQSLIHLFLASQVVKSKAKPKEFKDVKHVGVVGAGIMGSGIAYVSSSRAHCDVTILDMSKAALASSKEKILEQASRRDDKTELIKRINTASSYSELADCDLVVEAVLEDFTVKNNVYNATVKGGFTGILASNTSSIPISAQQKCVWDKEKLVGLHYFNPVKKMPLVEIIRGEHTSDEAIDVAKSLVLKQGKTAIVVNDCAGFYVNRVLIPYLNVCMQALAAGTDYVDLDRYAKAYGWPMGPFELLDTIGLDVGLHIQPVMAKAYPNNDFMIMTEADLKPINDLYGKMMLGNKSPKGGIYKNLEPTGNKSNTNYYFDRAMKAFTSEIKHCIMEGIVGKEEAVMGVVMGLGFPAYKVLELGDTT